ncbi:alpha beta fold family [Fusarium denticulatum]|uniref:Alpha beta fold family n=1 Tax=Fusarium denticulatum TaxID=48507 RepID=A0A8H5XA26_9HYPO|nr:alpha beta fold family [Fusarium denticulatum]
MSSLVDPPQPLAQNAVTRYVRIDGKKIAYRRFGKRDGNPIIYLTHLRSVMDELDPLPFNYMAQYREIILLENEGIGHSEGTVPDSVAVMAETAVASAKAMGIKKAVWFGFSLGGFLAQYISWTYPEMVEKAILSGTMPGAGPGVTAPDPNVFAITADPREPGKDDLISLMFAHTETSKALGEEWIKRRPDRRVKGETVTPALGEPGMHAQLTAIANWAGNKDNFARLKDIKAPVLITNGHKDIMLPTVNSFIMQQEIPYAFLHIYPDSAHGHLFQYPKQYAELVKDFLDMGSGPSSKL